MKRIIKFFVFVAAAAMTLASCQKNEITGPVKKEVNFTIKADMAETKTAITDNGDGTYSPKWKGGDKIAVLFSEPTKDCNKDTEFVNANGDGAIAQFEGKHTFETEEGVEEVEGTLYAFYPSTAFKKGYQDGTVRLDLPAVQNPTSTSFDPACDLLVAKPCDYRAAADGDAYDVLVEDMYFARLISVLRINLNSDFLEDEIVKSVSFDADGLRLTGAMAVDPIEGVLVKNNSTTDLSEVQALYTETDPIAVSGEKNSAYLVVAPVTIPSGTTLTFTIETENYDIVKTVSAPSDMVMPAGNIAVINLNIKEEDCAAKTEDTSDFSGTYAILTKRSSGGYYYMTNDLGTASTKRFTAVPAGETLPEVGVALGASKLWDIIKSGEGYVVKSVGADQYITWTSGNSANLGNEGIVFTIGTNDDGTFQLSYNSGTEVRYLSLNNQSGSDYFAMYSSNQVRNLNLIPAVQGEEPSVLTATVPAQMAAAGGQGSFTYTLTNPKDGKDVTAEEAADWIENVTVNQESKTVSYTVKENATEESREAEITLKYEGHNDVPVVVSQAGKQAAGVELKTWTWAGGGKSAFDEDPNVVEINGLGSDYAASNAPYNIKLDGTGDYFVVKVDGAVQSVSVGVKMLGGANTSYLDFQGSSDGSSYSSVQKHTISGKQNDILELTTSNTFDASYRYIKFNFTKGSNVGVGPITITYIPDNEGGSGGEEPEPEPDPTPDPEPSVKTYTLTIDASSFNTKSYAANNNEKTSTAIATDGTTMDVKWTSYQVMKQSSAMQWQKNAGYIYNSTDLGTITNIAITSSAGTFTKYINTNQKPTSNGSGGYFQVKVGNATGSTSKIVITFTK